MTAAWRVGGVFVAVAAIACNPAPPYAPISEECVAEIRNATSVVLDVTAFGRDKSNLGHLDPGESITLVELCRVERVPVRGTPVPEGTGREPVWTVVVLWAGETVRVDLGG